MTTLLDIPFECLPISVCAKLSTLNTQLLEKSRREYAVRNVGWEVYRHLCGVDDDEKDRSIHGMSYMMQWQIINSVFKKLPPSIPYWNVLVVPTFNPLRVYSTSVHVDLVNQTTLYSATTLDIIKPVPYILNGAEVLAFTPEEARQRIQNALSQIVWSNLPQSATCTWVTDEFPMYMINVHASQIYSLPPYAFSDEELHFEVPQAGITIANGLLPFITKMIVDADIGDDA